MQLFHGDKANDLKVLYGIMFEDVLKPYTHWGWMDTDVFFGDMSPMLQDLEHYDVVTYPNGVCLFDSKCDVEHPVISFINSNITLLNPILITVPHQAVYFSGRGIYGVSQH